MEGRKWGKLEKREKLTALLFVSPLMIGFIVFTLICMVISVAYSFTNYNPVAGRMDFVGLAQFNNLFTHPTYKRAFLDSIVNTLFLLLATPLSIVISLLLASLMNSKRFMTMFRAFFTKPPHRRHLSPIRQWPSWCHAPPDGPTQPSPNRQTTGAAWSGAI